MLVPCCPGPSAMQSRLKVLQDWACLEERPLCRSPGRVRMAFETHDVPAPTHGRTRTRMYTNSSPGVCLPLTVSRMVPRFVLKTGMVWVEGRKESSARAVRRRGRGGRGRGRVGSGQRAAGGGRWVVSGERGQSSRVRGGRRSLRSTPRSRSIIYRTRRRRGASYTASRPADWENGHSNTSSLHSHRTTQIHPPPPSCRRRQPSQTAVAAPAPAPPRSTFPPSTSGGARWRG